LVFVLIGGKKAPIQTLVVETRELNSHCPVVFPANQLKGTAIFERGRNQRLEVSTLIEVCSGNLAKQQKHVAGIKHLAGSNSGHHH